MQESYDEDQDHLNKYDGWIPIAKLADITRTPSLIPTGAPIDQIYAIALHEKKKENSYYHVHEVHNMSWEWQGSNHDIGFVRLATRPQTGYKRTTWSDAT